jgi:hypothetical protein
MDEACHLWSRFRLQSGAKQAHFNSVRGKAAGALVRHEYEILEYPYYGLPVDRQRKESHQVLCCIVAAQAESET